MEPDEWDDAYQSLWEAESDPFDPTLLAAYRISIDAPDGPHFIGRIIAPFPSHLQAPGWIWRAEGGMPHGIADSRRQAIMALAVHTALTMPHPPSY